jgi:imidazolonepropionase-like amidohydrolase
VDAAAAAHRAGVRLLAGTDDMGRQSPNIHGELQLLVRQVGLTPLEAIRSATQYGAEALGAQDSLGTIAPGKVADLVVLRADPSADIRNTQTIAYVMQRGRLHARTEPWHRMPLADPPGTPVVWLSGRGKQP